MATTGCCVVIGAWSSAGGDARSDLVDEGSSDLNRQHRRDIRAKEWDVVASWMPQLLDWLGGMCSGNARSQGRQCLGLLHVASHLEFHFATRHQLSVNRWPRRLIAPRRVNASQARGVGRAFHAVDLLESEGLPRLRGEFLDAVMLVDGRNVPCLPGCWRVGAVDVARCG